MRKSLLVAMMLCCSVLFGCAKGQTIDQEALAELQEDDDITYEEWKAEYDERLRKATLEGIKEANETLDSFMEASKPHEACDGISSNDCKKDDNPNTDSFGVTKVVDKNGFCYVYGYFKASLDYDYLEISFPIYNSSGNRIGTVMDNITDVKKGDTWNFKAIGSVNGFVDEDRVTINDAIVKGE